jgi:hypothetical protein
MGDLAVGNGRGQETHAQRGAVLHPFSVNTLLQGGRILVISIIYWGLRMITQL